MTVSAVIIKSLSRHYTTQDFVIYPVRLCLEPHLLLSRLQLEAHFVTVNSHVVSMQRLEGRGAHALSRILAVAEVCVQSTHA